MPQDTSTYLPQTDTPSDWKLDILGAGFAAIAPNQEYPPRQHPADHYFQWERGRTLTEYQILLITEGHGTLETERTGSIEFESPFLFILFPGEWHRYRPDGESGWHEHWISFQGKYVDNLHAQGIINPSEPFFHVGHNETLLSQFQLVHREALSESLGFRRICAAAIIQILAHATILPTRAQEENHAMRSVIRKACFLMRERIDTTLSPETLASELNVGYTYFRRLFKKYTGLSPKRYHDQLRFLKAKSLLRDTTLSVSEIADNLAFDSPFHFSNWFKKQAGLAPSRWR